jgi:hypothetical protein
MKDKSGEFPVRLVLHKVDEGQIRRFPVKFVLHKKFSDKNHQHQSLTKLKKKTAKVFRRIISWTLFLSMNHDVLFDKDQKRGNTIHH